MSRKKNILIIAVNVILLLIVYFCFTAWIRQDMFYNPRIPFLSKQLNYEPIDISKYNTEPYPSDFVKLEDNNEIGALCCDEQRKTFGSEYTKNPVIVFGCSYAYGHCLQKDETFSSILSKQTKHPVYNYSGCASNAYDNLTFLERDITQEKELAEIYKNTDYVIYIYMYDHINRYLRLNFMMELYDKLFDVKPVDKILSVNFLTHWINIRTKLYNIFDEYPQSTKSCVYLKDIMLKWYNYMKEITPKAQFIIILYDEKIPSDKEEAYIKYVSDVLNSTIWQEIEQETNGRIKVIHTKDLLGFYFDKDYKLKADFADWHPNAKVWEIFTPKFVEKYIKD